MNVLSFIGRLGREPEQFITANGAKIAKSSIAIDQGRDKPPIWLTLSAFGKTGERLLSSCTKGTKVFIVGQLSLREFEGKDGGKKQVWEVMVNSFNVVDGWKNDKSEQEPARNGNMVPEPPDSDVPF